MLPKLRLPARSGANHDLLGVNLTSSLSFRALDHHVINGSADSPAMIHGDRVISYAELLHEAASLAGGLVQLGVTAGTPLFLRVPVRRVWVLSILSIVRVGAIPDHEAEYRIDSDPAIVTTPDGEFDFESVLAAGRIDPAPARRTDDESYAQALTQKYGDVIAPLLHGGTIT